jgi:hypothetical protein
MRAFSTFFVLLSTLLSLASAQFGFFDQMFGGAGEAQGQRQQAPNVPSDANWYREHYDGFKCDRYLCPDTLGAFLSSGQTQEFTNKCLTSLSPQHAYTSHTTALVHSRPMRISSRRAMVTGSVYQKAGSRLARRRGRSSWLVKACCEETHEFDGGAR